MPKLDTYHGVHLWYYVPSLPAAIIFTIIFTVATIAHSWKMFKARMWFCLPFVIGGVLEIVGYICRAAAYNLTGSLIPYLLQAIFLVLPPVLFAATLYMVYSRVVRAVHGESFSLISPHWTTRIFVLGDWVCLNVQSGGSGLLAKSDKDKVRIGEYIVVAGLILQVLIFAIFMWFGLTFNLRFRAHLKRTGAVIDVPWQSFFNMMYLTSLAILVRNVFRVVEFIMGQDGYLFENEWPTYVFDGALMFLVMVAFYIWHPIKLQRSSRESMIELTSDAASSAEHGGAAKHSGPA
ncbi:Fc.00g084410.m01.CDS01 [Cosmosporella sp. VM-42]